MNPSEIFEEERSSRIDAYSSDSKLVKTANEFLLESIRAKYSYNFSWLSRPVIQYPQDIVAVQEFIWRVKPDLIIETGIAHGGSLILSASLLAMLDYCEAVEKRESFDPHATRRRVLGIDIDIRAHNRLAIESHPMSHRIDMIQGSSIAKEVIEQVQEIAKGYKCILICLDSNHTHDHVLAELEAYAPLTTPGSYCCVFDTVVEDLPDQLSAERPWGKGNNPKTAVQEFLRRIDSVGYRGYDGSPLKFDIDKVVEQKLLVTVAPGGYLRRLA
jgi:cephalosporin hydroxylase